MAKIILTNNASAEVADGKFEGIKNIADGGTCVDISDVSDGKFALLLKNAAATDTAIVFTIKAGDGIQGVNDLTVSVAKGAMAAVSIETGRFKIVKGENKGKVRILANTSTSGSAALAAVLVLP